MDKLFNAFIFARGGSKGIPNKNLQKFNGVSLVKRSLNIALELDNISRVFLSTDSDIIANEAKNLEIEIILRPKHLAEDTSSELEAWKHAIKFVSTKYGLFEKFLSIPPTAPLREISDVKNIMSALKNDLDLVLGISKSKKSPWFNMVKISDSDLIQKVIDDKNIVRRQDTPVSFDITTVAYASFTQYIMNTDNLLDGKIKGVEIPEERALDIDNFIDLEIANYFLSKNKSCQT